MKQGVDEYMLNWNSQKQVWSWNTNDRKGKGQNKRK
jgi:hypothetical protein